jgi:hypothetical protein
MTSPDSTAQDVTDDLDSFYCHNIVVSPWADAAANRLHVPGRAIAPAGIIGFAFGARASDAGCTTSP